MHIKSKSKESLKALYSAFENVVRKMNKEVQDQLKARDTKAQKASN